MNTPWSALKWLAASIVLLWALLGGLGCFVAPPEDRTADATVQSASARMPWRGLGYFQGNDLSKVPLDDPQLALVQYDVLWRNWDRGDRRPGGSNWDIFQAWRTKVKAAGKGYVLRIEVYQNRGTQTGLPADLAARVWVGPQGFRIPKYTDPTITTELGKFLSALAAEIGSDPALAGVQVATGLYGETHPERNDAQWAGLSWLYEPDPTGGKHRLEPCDWIAYVKRTLDAYHAAFAPAGVPMVLMNATRYGFPCTDPANNYAPISERRTIDEYAAGLGIGFQNNGLDEWDANWYSCEVTGSNGPYMVDGAIQAMVDHPNLPGAFERGSWLSPFHKFLSNAGYSSWHAYMNAISNGADVIWPPNYAYAVYIGSVEYAYPAGVFGYPEAAPFAADLRAMNAFAIEHLGRSGAERPDAWIGFFAAPKATTYWYCTAQQNDYRYGISQVQPYGLVPAYGVGPVEAPWFEGKYARRTDQAAGVSRAGFKIDPALALGKKGWEVEVWFLDNGPDSIAIDYGRGAGRGSYQIAKTGSGRWLHRVIALPDAEFSGGAAGDVVLDSLNDGPDEYYAFLRVKPFASGPAEATATSTPTLTATSTHTPPAPTQTATPAPTSTPTPVPTWEAPAEWGLPLRLRVVPGDRRLEVIFTW